MNAAQERQHPDEGRIGQVEAMVAWLLRVGVSVSATCIAAGALWSVVAGGTGYPAGQYPTSIGGIWLGLMAAKPLALVVLGLLLLIATPVLRVGLSVIAFRMEKDRQYVWITLYVLAVLVISFLLGKAGA